MEFHIDNTEVCGLSRSIIASGNAMRTIMKDNTKKYDEKDLKRAMNLGATPNGEGHDNYLKGIDVYFDIYAPLFMWKEIQRYHWFDIITSQSTMHRLTKFKIAEQCVSDVDPIILIRYQVLLDEYHRQEDYLKTITDTEELQEQVALLKDLWRVLVASLPSGFVLGATIKTNYLQLKTMYKQRKNHKLKEWHSFCAWCESLPLFKELILGDKNVKN